MIIRLNGEIVDIEDGLSISGLLEKTGVEQRGSAVELNNEVIPRANHATTFLKDNDKVEVIRAVGGG